MEGSKMTSKVWAWIAVRHLLTCGGIDLVGEDQKSVLSFECFELSDIHVKCWVECIRDEVQRRGLSRGYEFGSWPHEVVFKAIRLDEIVKIKCWKRRQEVQEQKSVSLHPEDKESVWRTEKEHPVRQGKPEDLDKQETKWKGDFKEEEVLNFSRWWGWVRWPLSFGFSHQF